MTENYALQWYSGTIAMWQRGTVQLQVVTAQYGNAGDYSVPFSANKELFLKSIASCNEVTLDENYALHSTLCSGRW